MTILVTGAAGFIGFHVCRQLLENGHNVIGIDNINDYYDMQLKYDRLGELGIHTSHVNEPHETCRSDKYPKAFVFIRMDITESDALNQLFIKNNFEVVCHLAAQAGVRYSLENPRAYIDSNLIGFFNILESCRRHNIKHLVYASSSSVYGMNTKIPFETSDPVDHPISLYAATKKSNELMAHTYSHLYGFPTTGLRFFTVYGPWGRPDMAMFLFTKAILSGEPIKVYNQGEMERDFTYIDDITEGVIRILESDTKNRKKRRELYKVYNIGNNKSVKLTDFIKAIEKSLGLKAQKQLLPMQPGDVERTWANVDMLIADYNYRPDTTIEEGVDQFIDWYRSYYGV